MYGKRIKQLRLELGMSQDELCNELAKLNVEIKRSTLACYEAESREPSISMVCTMADFFNVTSDYILGLSDYINKEHEENIKSLPLSTEQISSIASEIYKIMSNKGKKPIQ